MVWRALMGEGLSLLNAHELQLVDGELARVRAAPGEVAVLCANLDFVGKLPEYERDV